MIMYIIYIYIYIYSFFIYIQRERVVITRSYSTMRKSVGPLARGQVGEEDCAKSLRTFDKTSFMHPW